MRRSSVALISLIGPLLLGACTDRDSTAPRGIAPGESGSRAVLVAAATCDASAIKTAQTAYFTSRTDSSVAYIAELKKAYGAADYPTANALVYKIGRLVAKERLTPATTDATTGGIFLINVLRCLTDPSALPAVVPEDISEFVPNATSVVKSGIWEIRGGTENSEVPAAGRVKVGGVGDRAFGLPRWGAEATGSEWPGATQYVVFGYPTNVGTLVLGSPANINTNEVEANAFELGTIPSGTSKLGIRVGVCINQDPSLGVVNRVVHNNAEILDYSELTDLCGSGYQASADAASSSWYASALQRAGTLLAPKLLFAQGTDCTLLCVGGLPSDWSPFSANAITAATIMLSFNDPPLTNVTVGQLDTVVVRAAIGSTPVPGVLVTISISGNSGQPGGATFNNGLTSVVGTTGADGTATIIYSIGKAGGYALTTTGSIDGFPVGNSLPSTVFVKNP